MSGLQVRTRTNGEITLNQDTLRKFKESLTVSLSYPTILVTTMRAPSGTP